MKQSKKKWIIIVVCAVVLAALVVVGIHHYRPRPILSTPYTLSDQIGSDSDVCVVSVYFDGNEITSVPNDDETALRELLDLLSGYRCKPKAGAERYTVSNTWEINLNQGGKPIHIVVNDAPFCYSLSGQRYQILDAENLRDELGAIFCPEDGGIQ